MYFAETLLNVTVHVFFPQSMQVGWHRVEFNLLIAVSLGALFALYKRSSLADLLSVTLSQFKGLQKESIVV